VKKKIYFIIGIHKSIIGIYSYYNILQNLFPYYDIIIRKKIKKNSINILVENFNTEEVNEIINFKKKKKTKIILVITEFDNKNLKTFNCFDLNNVTNLKAKVFFFRNFLKFLRLRFFIKSKIKIYLKKYFNFNLYKYRRFKKKIKILFNINAVDKLKDENLSIKYDRYFYFKNRYANLNKVIDYADIILASHPAILNNYKFNYKKVFYVLPELKKFKPNKKVNFIRNYKFSGELNNYRKNFFEKNLNYINNVNIKNKNFFDTFLSNIRKYENNVFIDISSKHKFKFSFHPKKDITWPYSSPVRYIDAINNGEIPIVFEKFNDFFSNNLSIFINLKYSKSLERLNDKFYMKNIKFIKKGIIRYNKFIVNNNKLLTIEIKNLLTNLK